MRSGRPSVRWPIRRVRAPGSVRGMSGAADGGAQLDEVLHAASQGILAITRQLSTRDVLQMIVRSARSLLGARYAALGVPGDRDSFAEFVVDGVSASQWAAIGPLPRQHGMLAVLLREGRPLRLADIRSDPRFEGWPAAHPVLADFIGMPVVDGDDVIGIIFLANKRAPGGFTARDEELLSLFAAHAAIALTNARLYERSRELSAVQERARLARDLHDAVSQKLFSIRAKARAAAIVAPRDPARAAAEMENVADLSGEAHAELRAVIDGLLPPDLDAHGLAESLRRYAALAGRAHGMPVSFAADPLPPLPAATETAVYRVAQEALHNALRHSGAREVLVTLSRQNRRVVLEVSDDGRGFRAGNGAAGSRGPGSGPGGPGGPSSGPGGSGPGAGPAEAGDPRGADSIAGLSQPGLGLASMRERAASAGGTLTITSAPGQGTRVRLSVPGTGPGPGDVRPGRVAARPDRGSGRERGRRAGAGGGGADQGTDRG
jgi:signal transduction histidine kinase